MDLAGIREALHRSPFQAFTLALVDGRKLEVNHPDFIAMGTRRICVFKEDDSCSFVEPLLVVSIDYEVAPISTGSNGGAD